MECIDKTIEAVCSWIQKSMEKGRIDMEVPVMTKALAELVSAKAKMSQSASASLPGSANKVKRPGDGKAPAGAATIN